MSYWSVVQTESQREHIARMWMMRLGYETYAPRTKIKKRVALLFPSYIFARIVERWYPIMWTPGVLRILMNGDQPARLRDDVVTKIKKLEVRGLVKLPSNEPKIGSRMKIIRGPFEGKTALFDGMTGPERERVLLDLLGQMVPVELPTRDAVLLDVAS